MRCMAAMSGVEGQSFQLGNVTNPSLSNAPQTINIGAFMNLQKIAPVLYVLAFGAVGWFIYDKVVR